MSYTSVLHPCHISLSQTYNDIAGWVPFPKKLRGLYRAIFLSFKNSTVRRTFRIIPDPTNLFSMRFSTSRALRFESPSRSSQTSFLFPLQFSSSTVAIPVYREFILYRRSPARHDRFPPRGPSEKNGAKPILEIFTLNEFPGLYEILEITVRVLSTNLYHDYGFSK